jgi:glutathione S-transferase
VDRPPDGQDRERPARDVAGAGRPPFCCEGKYSLADIAVGCALGYLDFRFPQLDWRGPYPNLAKLAQQLAARPSFQQTVPPAA